MKIVTIIGARPQFIKAAAVSRAFSKADSIQEVIVHTGQHFDANMSKVFFDELNIPSPDYYLDVNGGNHGAMTGRMLEKIEEVLLTEQPDFVLVYGDTNSTLAGALAAKKLHIRVIHVEAGLRSFNMRMPEEINRILTDRISDILFCPTATAIQNLKEEGYKDGTVRIVRSGDVMQDAALYYTGKLGPGEILKALDLKEYILCTIHRAENTDDPERLQNIVEALNEINKKIPVLVPLHPRTNKIIDQLQLNVAFKTIEPVGYLDMIQLIINARLVMTDSGGLQKEAFFFRKNCVTLRDETEWIELIEHGVNVLAGSDKDRIVAAATSQLNRDSNFDIDLYGQGKASEIIVNEILNYPF